MNLTTEQLQHIIKEELQAVIDEKKGSKRKGKKKAKKKVKKDACYRKIKASAKVWPSAYASGRLVQCRNKGAANYGNKSKKNEELNENEFKPHMMYDPKSSKKVRANKKEDHERLAKKGYTHVDPAEIRKIIGKGEGGAAGMKPFIEKFGENMKDEIIKTLEAMPDIGKHKNGDYIMKDGNQIDVIKEQELEEKAKKACKPAKGKRFAKRVNGKCRSFGQKGQAKGGGDRIRPGTKKGDAYCARSAKIKKCKNPPCANALSRKKWKCRGSKSMKEVEND